MTIEIGDEASDGIVIWVGHHYANGNANVHLARADGTVRKNRNLSPAGVIRKSPEKLDYKISKSGKTTFYRIDIKEAGK